MDRKVDLALTRSNLLLLMVGLAVVLAGPTPVVAQTAEPAGSTVPYIMGETEGDTVYTPTGERRREEGAKEIVVDDENRLYQVRQYQGVIPGVRDTLRDKRTGKSRRPGNLVVTWVGFQPKALFSRVFIQADRTPAYTVFKPDPLHVVVEFASAKFRTSQERRTIRTHEFNSRVDRIDAKRLRGGIIQVVITLKEPTDYLYRQEGNYVFVDVGR